MDFVAQLKSVLECDGMDYDCHNGEFWFAMRCGPFKATFRVFQNGFLTVLMAGTDLTIPPERRSVVAEFCAYANFSLLAFGNLELNPDNGQVLVRHSLMIPADGAVEDDQFRWLIQSAAVVLSTMSKPLVALLSPDFDAKTVLNAARQYLHASSTQDAGFNPKRWRELQPGEA